MEYASLSGERSLAREFKILLNLLNQGLTLKESQDKIFKENLFQYSSQSSTKRVLSSLKKRLRYLNNDLLKIYVSSDIETTRIINLYLIMKSNKLLFDFMFEVIQEKYLYKNFKLTNSEIENFIENKKLQIPEIRKWSEQTLKRTKAEIKKILFDAGIIKNRKTLELQYIIINDKFKNYLLARKEEIYLKILGVKR